MSDSVCRICGCTQDHACEGGCSWVDDPENLGDLCSKCLAGRPWNIPLELIRPAPWNPPSRMDPAKVKELADSIRQEGQKSPALIRPVEAEAPIKFEIVFGHRRHAARQLLAQKIDAALGVLRAEIEEMDEERAMILAGIENLQRENFSDFEEAEFFRTCGDRYGESAVKTLSERLSVSDRYIRKRIEILKLPEEALALWRSDIWHVGHMEQLLRLGGNEEVLAFLKSLQEDRHREPQELAVWQLKDMLNHLAVNLHSGNFDKDECKTCRKNADCQFRLFGGEKDKGKCLDQACFKRKQQAWLDVNWPTCKDNTFGTLAAVIEDYSLNPTGNFSYHNPNPGEKCLTCQHFATILPLVRDRHFRTYRDKVCLGPDTCFSEIKKTDQKKSQGKQEPKDPEAPRVAWHGEHFRQEFYQQEIPQLMDGLSEDDRRPLEIALATLLYSSSSLHVWFLKRLGREDLQIGADDWFRLTFHQLLTLAKTLGPSEVIPVLSEILTKLALKSDRGHEIIFMDVDRQALAEFLDIDWSRFEVSQDYLNKKTKTEILQFIAHDSQLRTEPLFLEYLAGQGLPTDLEKLAQQKKGVLVNLILNCGVDLRGRLPREIADLPKLKGAES